MKRKIVQQGPTTLMASLPIKWVRKYGLSKGDEVDVKELGNKLVISTEKVESGAKTEIELDSINKSYIWRVLQPLYSLGYDEIKVNFESIKTLDIIQEMVITSLIGFEIVDQSISHCTIKSVSTEMNERFDSILRKIFLNLIYSSEIVLAYLERGENLDLIINLEVMNNRHSMFLKRVLTKNGYEDPKKTYFVYLLINYLEKTQNEYQYFAISEAKKQDYKRLKALIPIYKRVHEQIKGVYEVFYSYDSRIAEKIIIKGVNPLELKELIAKNSEAVHYFWEITKFSRAMMHQIIGIKGVK